MRISDWSSDVCSSDLPTYGAAGEGPTVLRVADRQLRRRPSVEITLPEFAAELAQDVALFTGFDALADRIDAQGTGQREDRAHQRQALGVHFAAEPGHEALVDLQRLDRETVQVRQRREHGADVVPQRQHAAVAQPVDQPKAARRVFATRASGDLDPQP